MRTFWGLILVLVLCSAGYLYGKFARPEPLPSEEVGPSPHGSVSLPAAPAADEPPPAASPVGEALSESTPPPSALDEASNPADPALDAASLDALLGTLTGASPESSRPLSDAGEVSLEPEPATTSADPEVSPAPESRPTPTAPAAAEAPAGDPAPAAPAPPAPAEAPLTRPVPTFAGYELVPAARTIRDNGSLLLDDKYAVSGKGTEADPYKITWDLLTSSSETLAPRQGKKKLPERITMLDGKWVELSGYIAFPLMVQEADELLLMLNQWDGCCIGIPPTPYDAIEVSLTKQVKGQDRFATQGSLKGKLGVKPHLVGEWLVGIYVMDSATLSTKSVGGFAQ